MNLKALVVDDCDTVRRVVARMVVGLGAREVHQAVDGAAAVRAVEASVEPFDVAIIDLDMPTCDGLLCLRRLAALPSPPAVIVMSGADHMLLDGALRLGDGLHLRMLGSIGKPVCRDALATALGAARRAPAADLPKPSLTIDAAEIAEALEAERFQLWFQPQMHVPSGQIAGFEGLVRLQREDGTVLGPDAFLKTAEASGLLAPLSEFVLREAVGSLRTWPDLLPRHSIALNLSRVSVQDLSLPDRAQAACVAQGVSPGRVVIELTESALAADPTAQVDVISRLRLKGFRLSLDDFGVGYSSLEDLRSLPFQELKLDRQFVQAAPTDPRARAILESAIALAAELRMTIVAEGVETPAMLDLVSALGCQLAQGYLIGRPMPASQIPAWLSRRPAHSVRPTARAAAPASPVLDGRSLSRFLHDAASPIMTLLAVSEARLEDPTLDAEQRSDLEAMHGAAEALTEMLRTARSIA